jgi:hypothetical protein
MLPSGMTQVNEIKPEDIRGVVYVDTGTPGRVNSVKSITQDGHVHVYDGEDLESALAVAKRRFRPEPDPNSISDQPSKV